MIEFNPDGSIKIPGRFNAAKERMDNRFAHERVVRITKDVVSFDAPKKCALKVEVSPSFPSSDFIFSTFEHWKNQCMTPVSLSRVSDREFEVIVGTSFKRCSECTSFTTRFENGIIRKGNCTYEGW